MADAPSGSALVLGGSIAGLLAAAALSASAERVLIVERDEVHPDGSRSRIVPQGTQVHALLGAGQQAMAALLPGIVEELMAAGGAVLDSPHEIAIFGAHGWTGRVPSGMRVVFARRPLLERVVRARVIALPNVTVRQGTAEGLVMEDDRVTAVRLADEPPLGADLIVDATGRTSQASDWLFEVGQLAPQIRELNSYVSYATATVALPDGSFPAGVAGVISHPHPGALRGASVVPCDSGLYQLSALGMMRAVPTRAWDGFLAHLDCAPSPLIAQIARTAEVVETPVLYKVRGSLRRVWELRERPPRGFLLIGDSVMSFNPLYGQGMSVAACEALALRDEVAARGLSDPDLAAAAQAAFVPVLDTVFTMVVNLDAGYPGAELNGVSAPGPEAVAFGRALSQLATEDPEIGLALKYAGHYFDPTALRSPEVAAKVRAWIDSGAAVTHTDPRIIPPALDVASTPA